MQDLSRWMWVSTRPPQIRQPAASNSGASAISRGSIAAIRPSAMPMSVGGASGACARRALRTTRSISVKLLFQVARPERKDLGPGLFRGQRVVHRALREAEAVMRTGEYRQLVPRAGLRECRLQRRDDILRHRLIVL